MSDERQALREALEGLRDAARAFRGNKPYRESDETEQPLLDALMRASAALAATHSTECREFGERHPESDCICRAPLRDAAMSVICNDRGPKLPPDGFQYLCTEPTGHDGDHLARSNFPDDVCARWPALATPSAQDEGTPPRLGCLTCGAPFIDALAGACGECGATDGYIGTQWLSMPADQRPFRATPSEGTPGK